MNGLPTPRTTLRTNHVTLLVWCKGGCQHQAHADLQALIDQGKRRRAAEPPQVPLFQLRQRPDRLGNDRQRCCHCPAVAAVRAGLADMNATRRHWRASGAPSRAAGFGKPGAARGGMEGGMSDRLP